MALCSTLGRDALHQAFNEQKRQGILPNRGWLVLETDTDLQRLLNRIERRLEGAVQAQTRFHIYEKSGQGERERPIRA